MLPKPQTQNGQTQKQNQQHQQGQNPWVELPAYHLTSPQGPVGASITPLHGGFEEGNLESRSISEDNLYRHAYVNILGITIDNISECFGATFLKGAQC